MDEATQLDNTGQVYRSPYNPHAGSIVYMTDPQREIKQLKLSLMNGYIDTEGRFNSYGKPLMNDDGIAKVIGFVSSVVNTPTNMTNLTDDKIEKIIMMNAEVLIRNLMVNGRRWEITGNDAKNLILMEVTNLIFVTLNRSLEEGERRFWKGSQQEIHTRIENTSKSKGLLDGIMSFKRGS